MNNGTEVPCIGENSSVKDCQINGKLTVGRNSVVRHCYVARGAEVTIGDNCYIDCSRFVPVAGVSREEVGDSCTMFAASLDGRCTIGADCFLMDCVCRNTTLGDRCHAIESVLHDSEFASDCLTFRYKTNIHGVGKLCFGTETTLSGVSGYKVEMNLLDVGFHDRVSSLLNSIGPRVMPPVCGGYKGSENCVSFFMLEAGDASVYIGRGLTVFGNVWLWVNKELRLGDDVVIMSNNVGRDNNKQLGRLFMSADRIRIGNGARITVMDYLDTNTEATAVPSSRIEDSGILELGDQAYLMVGSDLRRLRDCTIKADNNEAMAL